MALTVENELGTLAISRSVFAQIISDVMDRDEFCDIMWAATPRGRKVGIIERFSDTEFSIYIDLDQNPEGSFRLEFSVIVQFGIPIRETTRGLADAIAQQIEGVCGRKPSEITINIAGVRSRQIARRYTKVVFSYESGDGAEAAPGSSVAEVSSGAGREMIDQKEPAQQ